MKCALLSAAFCAFAGAAMADNANVCQVHTFLADGHYLASVLGADGQRATMTKTDADSIAATLNARHNTGANPVLAQAQCNK